MDTASELTNTCVAFYLRHPTKISPELVLFKGGNDFISGGNHNILRPETVESLFLMWRKTKDPIYRDWGWEIFQGFEQYSRSKVGYGGVIDVRKERPYRDDTMQSFFLAETLKYLYLLFSEDELLPLDKWVLNTEAHPLRITPDQSVGEPSTDGSSDISVSDLMKNATVA